MLQSTKLREGISLAKCDKSENLQMSDKHLNIKIWILKLENRNNKLEFEFGKWNVDIWNRKLNIGRMKEEEIPIGERI